MEVKEKIEIAVSIIEALGVIVGVVGAIVTIYFGFNQIKELLID